jgi:hypothetical protein
LKVGHYVKNREQVAVFGNGETVDPEAGFDLELSPFDLIPRLLHPFQLL